MRYLLALSFLFLMTSQAYAQRAGTWWGENLAGRHQLFITESNFVAQNIDPIASALDTMVTVAFPGSLGSGKMTNITWINESASADTIWKFFPSKNDSAKAGADSVWFVVNGGEERTFKFVVTEGDSFRIDKNGAGNSYGYIGGAKYATYGN